MSLNKFMHPRNRYRKPPDFKALAIKYQEFRKYAKQDISGKVSLNFKDLEAVRALTRTLLLEDFSLDVEIPLDRLIPTLPLRLNYLLWIEDLLGSNKRTSDVKGIDIGCGASCVYPLLAAKQFGWRMLATEVDMESAFIASRNVKKNNLQDMIKVRTVNEGQMLEGIVEPNTTYDFCMCNPPFFSSIEELEPKNVSRSLNRPAPRNAHSGMTTELVAPGGETAFVAAIIRDSNRLKTTVRIYSTMVGHKTSVGKVRQALQEAGVASASITTSEFCQGRTTRWGVAWTLDSTISFPQPTDVSLKRKKAAPLCHTFQSDLTSTVGRLKMLLEQLQITYNILKSNQDLCAMEITAVENTWANSRKKRRQEKLKQKMAESNGQKVTEESETNMAKAEESGTNMAKAEESGTNMTEAKESETNMTEAKESETNMTEAKESETNMTEAEESGTNMAKAEESGTNMAKAEESGTSIAKAEESGTNMVKSEECGTNMAKAGESGTNMTEAEESDQRKVIKKGSKRTLHEGDEISGTSDSNLRKKPKLENTASSSNIEEKKRKELILHGSLMMKKISEGCSVELTWLKGSGGRDSAHQVLQYLKNNFEPH